MAGNGGVHLDIDFHFPQLCSHQHLNLDLDTTDHTAAPRAPGPIRLGIEHADLIAAGPRRQPTLSRIQKELPGNWKAQEEQPKQLFFQRRNSQGQWEQPQWSHPDPNFDSQPYKKQPNAVSYEALSYTWGSEATAEMAHIVSDAADTESSTLPLGRNLADALRDLRYEDHPRTLWVDAICINQTNPDELGMQVARAGTVYEEARQVVIWLGRESPDSGLAMRAIEHLGSQVMVSAAYGFLAAPGATETNWHLPTVALPYDSKTWAAIDSLLRRRWFTRVWIQQEVHLADEAVFLCGREEVARDIFWRAVRIMQSKQQLDAAIARPVVTATMRALLPLRSTCTIFHITGRTWNGQCKNERDYVYGALGLFPPSFRGKITIDYCLSSARVYTDFVTQHIKHVQRLEMLRLCDLKSKRPEVPSWVPDFVSRSSPNAMPGSWHFSAGHSACDVEIRGLTLEAVGVEADVVRSVSEVIPLGTGKPDGSFEAAVVSIRRIIKVFQAEHAGTELGARPENFMWALLGTFLHDRLPKSLFGERKDVESIIQNSGVFGDGKPEDLVEGHLSFPEHQCLDLLSGRRVVRTMGGLLGIMPPAAGEGDIIACFLGCESPIALRRTDGGYRVIGECLMPGLADLRAFLGPLPGPWKVKCAMENTDGAGAYRYWNTETETWSDQDPRLGPLPDDLEVVPREEVIRTVMIRVLSRCTGAGEQGR